MDLTQQPDVIWRLRSAAGHLRAVMEMVEAGKSCKEVLHQLHAVQSALQAAGTLLIACQARESEAIIRENPDPDERVAELVRLRGFFMELTHYTNPNREVNP